MTTTPQDTLPALDARAREDAADDEVRIAINTDAERRLLMLERTLPFEISKHLSTVSAHVIGIYDACSDPLVRSIAVCMKASAVDAGEAFVAALSALPAQPTPSATADAGDRGEETRAEEFIQAAIDTAPEPLKRLGRYLADVLDEDQWPIAERMLLGGLASTPAPRPAGLGRAAIEVEQTYTPALLHYSDDDRLEFVLADTATLTRHLADGCAVLLDMTTREPIGFYVEQARSRLPKLLADPAPDGQPAVVAEPAEAWRPIETAPKDGTVVLAFTEEAQSPRATITWWSEDRWLTTGKPEKFVDPRPHRWWPTHWQPLPKPPIPVPSTSRQGE